jgi:hypothetical protein
MEDEFAVASIDEESLFEFLIEKMGITLPI